MGGCILYLTGPVGGRGALNWPGMGGGYNRPWCGWVSMIGPVGVGA